MYVVGSSVAVVQSNCPWVMSMKQHIFIKVSALCGGTEPASISRYIPQRSSRSVYCVQMSRVIRRGSFVLLLLHSAAKVK